jgi:hypothetical protein
MRARHGIVALGLLGAIACTGSTEGESHVSAQVTQQAPADEVSILTVEGMT